MFSIVWRFDPYWKSFSRLRKSYSDIKFSKKIIHGFNTKVETRRKIINFVSLCSSYTLWKLCIGYFLLVCIKSPFRMQKSPVSLEYGFHGITNKKYSDQSALPRSLIRVYFVLSSTHESCGIFAAKGGESDQPTQSQDRPESSVFAVIFSYFFLGPVQILFLSSNWV